MKSVSRLINFVLLAAGVVALAFVLDASARSGFAFQNSKLNDLDKVRWSGFNKNSNSNANGNQNQNSNANSNSNSNSGNSANNNTSSTRLSIEQARQIALENVAGTVIKEEFKSRKGRSVYEFYIRKSNGYLYEVKIDASNGSVVEIESKDD